MGQPLLRNPLFLLSIGVSSLFVGAAFVYMSTKSPFYWGDLLLPGVVLILVFAMASILSVVNLLSPVRPSA